MEKKDITNRWNTPEVQQVLKDQIKEAGERSIQEHEDYKKELIEQGRQIGMAQGICLVIADAFRGYNVSESWKGSGLTIEECEQLQVDDHDLDVIKKYKNELK